jgi:hypothetical protein
MAEHAASYYVGVDLGQPYEYSAISVVEQKWRPAAENLVSQYTVRHLKRWSARTSYSEIVADVAKLVRTPPLDNPSLIVDFTAVGRPVLDLFRNAQLAAWLRPVRITGGSESRINDDGVSNIPKQELASRLQILLQTKRLQIAKLPERDLLAQELMAFRVKLSLATSETITDWREREHDDLVLAAALPVWLGEKHGPPMKFPVGCIPQMLPWRQRPSNAERRGFNGRGRTR